MVLFSGRVQAAARRMVGVDGPLEEGRDQVTTAGRLWKPAMRGGGNMTTKDDAPCGWSMTIAESQRMKGRRKSSIASDSFLAEFGHDVTGNLCRLPVMNRPCRDVSGAMWRKIRDDRTV